MSYHPHDETNNFFETPRWHRDGRMFSYDHVDEIKSRYVTTILGPPTRLLVEMEAVSDVVNYKRNKHDWASYAELLAGQPEVDVAQKAIVRLTCGQEDSPVHSEPDISDSDRVFVSILYGSEAEMTRLCEYPGKCTGKVWREQQLEKHRDEAGRSTDFNRG